MKAILRGLITGALGCALALQFFDAAAAGTKEKVIYSFGGGTDGANPIASLIDVKGTLFGTTINGGTNNAGTVFSVDAKTGAEAVLHAFGNGSDGVFPDASLIDMKGLLYGTTQQGGVYDNCNTEGCGTVFSLDPGTGSETVLHSFGNGADGVIPSASLLAVKGNLYGTTTYGGLYVNDESYGTVFAIDPVTGTETVLHSFCSQQSCADGAWPVANLIKLKGMLYGTTVYGDGTIFALDPGTGTETVLYTFCRQKNCSDGQYPQSGLTVLNGTLYGTTFSGGSKCQSNGGCGAVFAFDANTKTEKVIYSFCSLGNCTDGAYPEGNLIAIGGTLFGTTTGGGNSDCQSLGCGVVFSVDPATGTETVVYAFCSQQNCTDGWQPRAGLLNMKDTLYGTTYYGGANCQSSGRCGTVFAIKEP